MVICEGGVTGRERRRDGGGRGARPTHRLLGAVFALALSPQDAFAVTRTTSGTWAAPAAVVGVIRVVAACTNRMIGDDPSSSQRACCCHAGSQVACEPVERCRQARGICLTSDWGACHFPSLNAKTTRP